MVAPLAGIRWPLTPATATFSSAPALTNSATGGTTGVQTLHVNSNNTNSVFTVTNTNVTVAGQGSTNYSQFGTVTLTGGIWQRPVQCDELHSLRAQTCSPLTAAPATTL